MNEETLILKLFDLINTEGIIKDNIMSYELGEITLKLFELLTPQQKRALNGKFIYEDAYKRLEIEIDSDLVEIEYVDYSQEFDTGATLEQHEVTAINEALQYYESIQDITQNEKLDLTLKVCGEKPYLQHQVNYAIYAKECFLNMTHYHYYASVYISIKKEAFNYATYEDFCKFYRKLARHYYEAIANNNIDHIRATTTP